MLLAPDVATVITICGNPVVSEHKNRVALNPKTGRGMLFPSKEWQAWFASAINQVEKALTSGGHHVERELVIVKSGARKGLPGKNAHGQETNVINPLYHEGTFRIVVWYLRPLKMYVRDSLGSIKHTKGTKKEPAHPVLRAYKGLDCGNVAKGVVDALQEGGAINDDENVHMICTVELPILADGADSYVVVEIKQYDPEGDRTIPRPPISLVDSNLYMPRVLDSAHAWHVVKKQERAYQQQRENEGESIVPITLGRCRRCGVIIGPGWPSAEMWWSTDIERWGEKVVIVCSGCGESTARKTIEPHLDMAATHLMQEREPDPRTFVLMRRLAGERLTKQYREKHVLVAASEIDHVDWCEVSRRHDAKQREIYDTDHPDRRPEPPQRPALNPRTIIGCDFNAIEFRRTAIATGRTNGSRNRDCDQVRDS